MYVCMYTYLPGGSTDGGGYSRGYASEWDGLLGYMDAYYNPSEAPPEVSVPTYLPTHIYLFVPPTYLPTYLSTHLRLTVVHSKAMDSLYPLTYLSTYLYT